MPRYFTHYWRNDTVKNDKIKEGELLYHTAGNDFIKWGVQPGDIVYVVSNIKGQLHVLSKIKVAKICDFDEAMKELNDYDLWDASDHIIARAATPMNRKLRIPVEVTKTLQFKNGNIIKPLIFKAPNYLDNQTLRGVRELTPESAANLDTFLPELQQRKGNNSSEEYLFLPEELSTSQEYKEGTAKQIIVNAYERNQAARKKCIQHYGSNCSVCDFNFEAFYGPIGQDYIHVHHLTPLSAINNSYTVDPINDLRPICPNCHAMIHRRKPPFTIEELRELLEREFRRREE